MARPLQPRRSMPLLEVGEIVGAYQLLAPLGDGGMGEVHRAVRLGPHGFRREVALKVMAPGRAADRAYVAMFAEEARLAAELHHANLVPVVEYGERPDGLRWLAEELVEGTDLARLCRAAPLPLPVALFIATELLRGLRYLHGRQVVHQDVKPSNILVGLDGSVRLTDFGIAERLSAARREVGSAKGSPAYIAPECALLEPATPRSDLFGVGLVLCEMLAGRPLCASAVARRAIYRGELPGLARFGIAVDARVEALVRWLLAADPAARCPSAEEALRALDGLGAAGARALEALVAERRDRAGAEATAPTLTCLPG